jgi:Flp pilus assembly protein TadB
VFGRKDKAAAPVEASPVHEARPGAKNRPTPKRRDQEAARKQPLVVTDRKAAKAADRARRSQASGQMRQAMITGDDRHLPNRDKGPVRRFVRDTVDARWNVAEFLLPFMILVLVAQFVNKNWGFYIFLFVYVLVIVAVVDGVLAWRRLKKQLRAKFGEDVAVKGLGSYMAMRMMQMRPTRMPRPQVGRGEYPH